MCTFWHAVERKKINIPYIIKNTKSLWESILVKDFPQPILDKLPEDNLMLQISLQENEMFILGLSNELAQEAIKNNDKLLISKHLYLVWSISINKYWFRHHLETKNSELKKLEGARESKRFHEISSVKGLIDLNPIKVRLNHLGEITKIGE